jgi:acyl-CoA synthetase (NDP forming)
VTDTFKEFEQLLELATDLHTKQVSGTRIGAISNAGYEAVGMADTVRGARYQVEMPALDHETRLRLQKVLEAHKLDRLVDAKNPLDLTPMASDAAYEDALRVFCEAAEVDAVIVGCVPMTPSLLTTPDELTKPGSLAERLPRLYSEVSKPLIFVLDCAGPYDELARAVRAAGVPVLRSADQAVRSVGRYLNHRNARRFVREASRLQGACGPPTTIHGDFPEPVPAA